MENKNVIKKGILVIGDLLLDIYYKGSVSRISPEAPVPVLKKDMTEKYVPGGASNVAMNVIASGKKAGLVGVIGEDEYGNKLLDLLVRSGVNTSHIKRTSNIETISKTRYMSENNQQLLRVDIENVDDIKNNVDFALIENEVREIIGEYDLLVLSDYGKGMLNMSLIKYIIQLANRYNIRTLVDVKEPNIAKYKGAWLLKPNKNELNSLTNMPVNNNEEILEASKYLLEKSESKYVLTTCGRNGMVLVGRDLERHFDTVGKEVFDVTGAGDTVIAYLASALCDGLDITRAVEIANYAAGVQVGKVGTASVYIQEVKDVMDGIGSTYLRKKLRWRNLDDFNSKVKGRKIVFTNGCFDILHIGHKRYLEEARKLGDLLVVGVNSDDSVKRIKGPNRPINTERDRVEMLSALDCVDYVIVFEDDTPYDLIKRIKPCVLVKGGDYRIEEIVGRDIVEQNGGEVVIIPLVEGRSTTAVIDKIKK